MNRLLLLTKNQFFGAAASFVSRLDMLPANFSPLGSFGFFGGNPVLFGVTIIAFDVFVKGFYQGFWLTYIGFACYPVLGWLAKKSPLRQVVALPLASFLFFLISNLGVWLYWYDHTWSQLLVCYSLALPFYQRTLIGDLVFGYGYLLFKHCNFKLFTVKKSPAVAPTF